MQQRPAPSLSHLFDPRLKFQTGGTISSLGRTGEAPVIVDGDLHGGDLPGTSHRLRGEAIDGPRHCTGVADSEHDLGLSMEEGAFSWLHQALERALPIQNRTDPTQAASAEKDREAVARTLGADR